MPLHADMYQTLRGVLQDFPRLPRSAMHGKQLSFFLDSQGYVTGV
jgi:hypothetical protein